jgi:hypothetical protein
VPRQRARHRKPERARNAASVAAPLPARRPVYIVGGSRVDGPRDWRWKTFPVFFVAAVTLFLSSVLSAWFASEGWLRMTALFTVIAAVPVAIALAHLVTLRYFAPHAPQPGHREDK